MIHIILISVFDCKVIHYQGECDVPSSMGKESFSVLGFVVTVFAELCYQIIMGYLAIILAYTYPSWAYALRL